MAIPLPNTNRLITPLEYQNELIINEMRMGSLSSRVPIGFKPWRQTVTLQWVLSPTDALAQLQEFESKFYGGDYTFTCSVLGAVVYRPIGAALLRVNKNRMVRFFMPVELL